MTPHLLLLLATIASVSVSMAHRFQGTVNGFERIQQYTRNESDTAAIHFPVDHFQSWLPKVQPPQYRAIDLTPQECGWRAFSYAYLACNGPCEDFAYLLELVCEGDTDGMDLPYLYTACCKGMLVEYNRMMDAKYKLPV